ncbi:MAG: hypothetical protein CMK56_05640 [Proteobacteria bacterium]|nr:hypothetical protein [Pseudomonadota bacterium]
MRWYVLAAQQGHARAQFNVGVFYYLGETVRQAYHEAFKWYTFAAEQGHAGAQTNLGIMFSEGEGVPQNNLYAYMWANIGSMSGQKEAKGLKDFLSKKMTKAEIEKAQVLARKCIKSKLKGCSKKTSP